MFQSLGHRAWHAYYCLDRNEKGEPPAYRSLEVDHGLANGAMMKLIKGGLKRPGYEVLSKLAASLKVTPHWLQTGEGEPPRAAWPIPPYPYAGSAGLSNKVKAAFERDAKKLAQSAVARRAKSARK